MQVGSASGLETRLDTLDRRRRHAGLAQPCRMFSGGWGGCAPSCPSNPRHLMDLTCAGGRASRKIPSVPSPEIESQERNSLPGIAAPSQNIRSAGLSVPNDPTFAIARLIRIWLSLRASPIESLRSSTLNPQQSVLYVICEIEYRNIDCR